MSGPWAKKFLQPLGLDLPLKAIRIESLYWEADVLPNNARSSFYNATVNICESSEEEEDIDGCYMLPEYEYPGLIKVQKYSLVHM